MFNRKKTTKQLTVLIVIEVIIFIFLPLFRYNFFQKILKKNHNIILVSLDTLGANHLPCYGYSRNTAPNLCKFAQENILFENNFANAHFTFPSHVSIFTGLYPSQHKVNNPNLDILDKNIPFLPEILQKNGYKTHFVMSDTNYLPIDKVYNRGIDTIKYGSNPKTDWNLGLDALKRNNAAGKNTFLFLHTYWVHSPYIEGMTKKMFTTKSYKEIPSTKEEYQKCTENFHKYLIKKLEQTLRKNLSEKDKKRNLNLYSMVKLITNEENFKKFCANEKNFAEIGDYFDDYYVDGIDKNNLDHIEYIKALYDQEIFTLDENLKDLLSLVKSSELKDNTILIITADHGESFMEHGTLSHENLYDEVLKTPLIMYVPGFKNKKYQHLTQSVDIVPTILNLVGIKNNYKFAGRNIFDLNLFKNYSYAVAEESGLENTITTIRNGDWKLFTKLDIYGHVPYELYNIKNDPGEKENVLMKNFKEANRLIFELNKILGL